MKHLRILRYVDEVARTGSIRKAADHLNVTASAVNRRIMKCDALVRQGIQIDERVPLPDGMIPPDARVEIEAKIAAGYFAGDRPRGVPVGTVGRGLYE